MKITARQIVLTAFLAFMAVSAFAVRARHYLNTFPLVTVDEDVYYNLALNLSRDFRDYNLRSYAEVLKKNDPTIRTLPEYFTEPLFKHPPLFPFLSSLSLRLFPGGAIAAVYVSAFFGSCLIILAYFLGRFYFGERTGLWAALAVWLDPADIICSQKMWMDTMLSFFMLLSLLLFACGNRYRRGFWFILSGVAGGLAVNTKYPGGLVLIVIAVYALAFAPGLFRSRPFLISLLIPPAMLLPWLSWNAAVYGDSFVRSALLVHGNFTSRGTLPLLLLLGLLGGFGIYQAVRRGGLAREEDSGGESDGGEDEAPSVIDRARGLVVAAAGLAVLVALFKNLLYGFDLWHIPLTTWQGGLFRSPLFYPGRLLEFSPLYAFALLSFFWGGEREDRETALLYLFPAGVILFYMAWGGYQTRYILAALPVLLVLGLHVLGKLYLFLAGLPNRFLAYGGRAVFIVFALYLFLKVNYLNFLVSYPNNMCYF